MPGSKLAGLAEELTKIAIATDERGRQAHRPFLAIRAVSALAIGLALVGLWYLARHVHARWEFGTIGDLFDALNAGFNLLVLLAGALWFCVTLEARIKRKEALGFIEELREFAHVIDVTQLYYTPDLYRSRHEARPGNPAIDETYLLYCTQMLGVISNLRPYMRGRPATRSCARPRRSRCSPWPSPRSTWPRPRPREDEQGTVGRHRILSACLIPSRSCPRSCLFETPRRTSRATERPAEGGRPASVAVVHSEKAVVRP